MGSFRTPCLILCASGWLFACSQSDPSDKSENDGSGGGNSTGAVPGESGGAAPEASGAASVGGGASSSGGATSSDGSGGSQAPSGGAESGTGGLSASGGWPNESSGGQSNCPAREVELSVERLDSTRIADMGVPFPTDEKDLVGPEDWATQYGQAPQIVPVSSGSGLDILFQDQASEQYAYVVHVVPSSTGYTIDAAYKVESLGRIMGLAKDPSGNYYVATCVDEEDRVDDVYPPNDIHRTNIVRIVKFDAQGCVTMESDVDFERGVADPDSEIIVNPMVASTARLVWGADRLLLVHGHNTEPDPQINGSRHQKSIATHIDARDGSVVRSSTMWVSHSFDERAFFDGQAFVELHLGDAYPRSVSIGRFDDTSGAGGHTVFSIKGSEGANNTFTRLGSISSGRDETFGYLTLFATERDPTTAGEGLVRGTRDLAFVRVMSDFATKSETSPVVESNATPQVVVSAESEVTNYVHWLTQLEEGSHAERPRMAALPNGELIALFEKYVGNSYDGTFALRFGEDGNVLAGPTKLPGDHHLSRGDDIVSFENRIVYVTGGNGALHLNWVAPDLSGQRTSLP